VPGSLDSDRVPDRVSPEEARGPVDATIVPRFAGPATFARLPELDQVGRADVAIVGVPFDTGTSYRPGARFGPGAIRQGSRLLRPYNPALGVSPFAQRQVADASDLAITPFDIDRAVKEIEAGIDALAERAPRAVALGGDHTVALPILRSLHRRFGPVAVVHFDAHLDTWDTYFDAPVTHGTPFRRAVEEGLLRPGSCVHLGTRASLYSDQDLPDDARLGFQVISAGDIADAGVRAVGEAVRARVATAPVYVSVDVDVLDPAHAPGTGTPEPGGLSSRELLALVRLLSGLRVVGADVVEVSPAYDHAEITAIAAAHVVYELISIFSTLERTSERA
jgi:agmatinase